MKTILMTVYAVNPYRGSEDGMGWNFVRQVAKNHKVKAITRKNNRVYIDQFMKAHPEPEFENIEFHYYDLPYWMRFWKKKSRGAMLYFYLWQLFMPVFIAFNKLKFDIAHNLNFHNDWTPSMLWMFRKPFVWGPIGHHPDIPKEYVEKFYGKAAYIKYKRLWLVKNIFWKLDPFLKITRSKADRILCMNSAVNKIHKNIAHKSQILTSVHTEFVEEKNKLDDGMFTVLSVGRLVSLKGFDLTIEAFALFVNRLSVTARRNAKLIIVGDGPSKIKLKALAKSRGIEHQVEFIDWINRKDLTEIYRRAKLFLFPSHEGAGMVVAEAMSYGLPVVCLDNCGPGEFLDEKSGIKIPYSTYQETVDQLCLKLTLLFRNKQLLEEYSIGARQRFETYFDWDLQAENFKQIYDTLLPAQTANVVKREKVNSSLVTNDAA